MEKSCEELPTIDVNGGEDARRRVHRKLVQSTLFPLKPRDDGKVLDHCGLNKSNAERCDGEKLGTRSSDKKTRKPYRKRNSKTTPQSGASQKVILVDEVTFQGVDEEYSPMITRFDSSAESSKRQLRKRLQKKRLSFDASEENNETCSPPSPSYAASDESPQQLKQRARAISKVQKGSSTPKKLRADSTPKKQRINSTPKNKMRRGITDSCLEQRTTEQNENISNSIPNLRLEARSIAEENLRLFAGKQIHPFFTSQKMGKKSQETADLDNKWCSMDKKDFVPIHVFEKDEDNVTSLDWGKWKFSDQSFIRAACETEFPCSAVYKESVNSLEFDNFLRSPYQMQELSYTFSLGTLSDVHVPCCRPGCEMEEADPQVNWDVEWQNIFPERTMSYHHFHTNQPKNCVWATKYQPKKACEVCGNNESVRILNEWLQNWKDIGNRSGKNSSSVDKWNMEDDGFCWESFSDSEMDEDTSLKNVLLITGPVGSGKSAAVYACAKEQSFQVIEVNASDWRNGTLIKQKFREAVESHWRQSTVENLSYSENKGHLRISPSIFKNGTSHMTDGEVVKLINVLDEEDSQTVSKVPQKSVCEEDVIAIDQSETKILILFEDVDASLCDDRGFVATIQQLSETAKRPMILTSNSNNPVLPNNLDRLEVCFTRPSRDELLRLVYLVCDAEKVKIQPYLVDQFIECCQGDIRKIIMHIQFWCQGQSDRKDTKGQGFYAPLLFDIDAGHKILPSIIPWSYPSQLSELIAEEIAKSLLLVEENNLIEGAGEEDLIINKTWSRSRRDHFDQLDIVKTKMDAILSRHCSDQDFDEFIPPYDIACNCSNSSGSPVTFARRNLRRKVGTISSSESGEAHSNIDVPVISNIQLHNTNNEVLAEVNSKSPSHFMETERFFSPLIKQFPPREGEELQNNGCHHLETTNFMNFNGLCQSVDVSCVPESSFVPETEIKEERTAFSSTLSSGLVMGRLEPGFTTSAFVSDPPLQDSALVCSLMYPGTVESSFDLNMEPVHEEEVGDSHLESVEAVDQEYQAMDECSQMNFSGKFRCLQERTLVNDPVQDTWIKLRRSHMNLRQYVTPEQNDASKLLNLSYELSNIVSDTDLLLSDCQFPISDAADSSLIRCENSDSFNWYDDHLQMTSAFAQHGICYYAKQIAVGSHVGSANRVNLAWEMLASSSNTMALGKLLSQYGGKCRSLKMESTKTSASSKSAFQSSLCSVVQSVVPLRSHMKLKGDAFHEYLSSLGHISKTEASRLSDGVETTKWRRKRVPKHYLTTGSLTLAPEDILLLTEHNCYGKLLSQSRDGH